MKQNKAKKLFVGAVALSVAVAAGSVPAFATAQTPTYFDDMDTVTLTKIYELTNEGTLSPAESFHFTIEPKGVTDAAAGVTTATMPVPTIGSVEYAAGEAGSAAKAKQITIDLPEYDSVGVYTYTIRETAGTSAGVTYYGEDILLRVTVIEQDGKIRVAAVHTESPEATGDEKTDSFANTYSAGELSIHKDVEGNLGDKNRYFEFKVTLTGEEGKTYQESYAVTGGSNSANPTSVSVKAGESEEYTVYLRDDETLHIENLPYGVNYTVTETAAEGYDTQVEGDDGEVDSAAENVVFTNTKNGIIDTGVVLDNAPYLLTLATAAGAGLLITLRRRNQK